MWLDQLDAEYGARQGDENELLKRLNDKHTDEQNDLEMRQWRDRDIFFNILPESAVKRIQLEFTEKFNDQLKTSLIELEEITRKIYELTHTPTSTIDRRF